ncbi:1771_t:CDS:2 [Funneliformis caledonium]|uniref:1771_t:CDS:1 n=1 Tax=Funneliformis caledonium TaxID=1117310 RepID=A0A9N9C9J3_9GLOM|nr:1771_t:CDS:2 [Funneliformis caledonium]
MFYKSKSNHLLTILSILPILFFNALAYDEENDVDKSPQPPRLDSPENLKDFLTVVYVTIIMTILSLCGCSYVFYRTYRQWILNKKRSLPMIYLLPFYTAFSDFLINIALFINIIHTAIFAQIWDQPMCRIISTVHWGILTINLTLYSVIASITYTRVCCEIYFEYGPYDYKLWLIVIGISATFQVINIPNHGARKFWCFGRSGQIVSSSILFVLVTLSLIVILFCYIRILQSLMSKRDDDESSITNADDELDSAAMRKREEIEKKEKRAAKKIISYMLVFLLQWTPVQIDDAWIYILAATGQLLGGIGNAVNYILNEGYISRNSGSENEIVTNYETSNDDEK